MALDLFNFYFRQATSKPPFRDDTENLLLRDHESFDSHDSWNFIMCAVGMGVVALGVLHSCAFLGNFAPPSYQFTVLQTTLVSCGMYAAFIMVSMLKYEVSPIFLILLISDFGHFCFFWSMALFRCLRLVVTW